MNNYIFKFFRILLFNFIFITIFILIIELLFGYWFDKDNLGPYMREHRMKNQEITWIYKDEKIKYNYKRNYYGFRGEDIKLSEIKAIIIGGSLIDERYKPHKYTVTGYLNKILKENNINLSIINGSILAQSTVGIIYGLENWILKLKELKPNYFLYYVGFNDLLIPEDVKLKSKSADGHILNPDAKERFWDNFKSRSIIYDSIRILKHRHLPKKKLIKYDGNPMKNYKENFNFKNYEDAKKNNNMSLLNEKYNTRIQNYLKRIDVINEITKSKGAEAIFITNVVSFGHTEMLYTFNNSLLDHCKVKKYKCIDTAKKIRGDINFWYDGIHFTKDGAEHTANLIAKDLIKFFD
tara:strand:- start:4063 stop:5115 length:1053 start_codon:yes stop_codon:yes gene_type:complete